MPYADQQNNRRHARQKRGSLTFRSTGSSSARPISPCSVSRFDYRLLRPLLFSLLEPFDVEQRTFILDRAGHSQYRTKIRSPLSASPASLATRLDSWGIASWHSFLLFVYCTRAIETPISIVINDQCSCKKLRSQHVQGSLVFSSSPYLADALISFIHCRLNSSGNTSLSSSVVVAWVNQR